MKSVTASGNTVTFTLKYPDATWPDVLTTGAGAIVDAKVFPFNKLQPDAKIVGSGPYELQSYTPNQLAVFMPNPHYGGNDVLHNNRVHHPLRGERYDARLRRRSKVPSTSPTATVADRPRRPQEGKRGQRGVWQGYRDPLHRLQPEDHARLEHRLRSSPSARRSRTSSTARTSPPTSTTARSRRCTRSSLTRCPATSTRSPRCTGRTPTWLRRRRCSRPPGEDAGEVHALVQHQPLRGHGYRHRAAASAQRLGPVPGVPGSRRSGRPTSRRSRPTSTASP